MAKSIFFSILIALWISSISMASVNHSEGNPYQLKRIHGDIPLYFVENDGQVGQQVKYYSKTPDFTLWLTDSTFVFDKSETLNSGINKRVRDVSKLFFIGTKNDVFVTPVDMTDYKVNYYKGDRENWKTGVHTFQAIKFNNIYDNIDLKVYGVTSCIEYDWIVKPGSNPDIISFQYAGIHDTKIDDLGNIQIDTGFSWMMHKKPYAYQDIDGERVEIEANFQQQSKDRFGFIVGKYDKNYPLVIDPVVLTYSTYLGGAANPGGESAWPQEFGKGIAVNSAGNAYVTGYTKSSDFPMQNAYDSTLDHYTYDPGGGNIDVYPDDVFVTKFSADGKNLVFSTYLGGDYEDQGYGIALDSSGNAYVTGSTNSSDFPTTTGAWDRIKGNVSDVNESDAFITKLSSSGTMVYSTFLGGAGNETGRGIAVDSSGNACITGITISPDFPVNHPYDSTVNQWWDTECQASGCWRYYNTIFVTKLNSDGSGTDYSSYFGCNVINTGNLGDEANAIAVDSGGYIYVTGVTMSGSFPTKNYYDNSFSGDRDAIVMKINPFSSGNDSLVFSTFLGGTDDEWGYGIGIDGQGRIYVGGLTRSTSGFPTVNAYQGSHGGATNDGFVSKFNYSGTTLSLVYSTYIGGSGNDEPRALAVNSAGNAYVTGATASTDFPIKNAYDSSNAGGGDLFVTCFTTAGNALEYSTYMGGTSQDNSYGIAVDSKGCAYITGNTSSTDFPTANPYMTNPADGSTQDAFVSKLSYGDFPWVIFVPAIIKSTP